MNLPTLLKTNEIFERLTFVETPYVHFHRFSSVSLQPFPSILARTSSSSPHFYTFSLFLTFFFSFFLSFFLVVALQAAYYRQTRDESRASIPARFISEQTLVYCHRNRDVRYNSKQPRRQYTSLPGIFPRTRDRRIMTFRFGNSC